MADTIYIKRNNDRTFPGYVTENDVALDITNYSIMFSVKRPEDETDNEALIYKEAAKTDPTNGIFEIKIDAADTIDGIPGKYSYDLLIIDGDGKRHSSCTGLFILLQEITDGDYES